jgi:hypothetical protein
LGLRGLTPDSSDAPRVPYIRSAPLPMNPRMQQDFATATAVLEVCQSICYGQYEARVRPVASVTWDYERWCSRSPLQVTRIAFFFQVVR